MFARTDRVAEGWYWALPSSALKKGEVKPVNLMGKELALFRTQSGQVKAIEAYCPHMGAHLAEGKVVGEELRCFFHGWHFNGHGECTRVPSLPKPPKVKNEVWPTAEKYGLIWVYTAKEPRQPVPYELELGEGPVSATLGNQFSKNCHPNVVLINAIDIQHFQTVHHIPNVFQFETTQPTPQSIHFANQAKLPPTKWWYRLIQRFYAGPITYVLTYWSGSTGTVRIGPDFLHFYIMFALRQGPGGTTEGQTVLLTKQRKGLFGALLNSVLLWATQRVGNYFANGDTKVFQTIRFALKTPIKTDYAIVEFARAVERLTPVEWGVGKLPDPKPASEAAKSGPLFRIWRGGASA